MYPVDQICLACTGNVACEKWARHRFVLRPGFLLLTRFARLQVSGDGHTVHVVKELPAFGLHFIAAGFPIRR